MAATFYSWCQGRGPIVSVCDSLTQTDRQVKRTCSWDQVPQLVSSIVEASDELGGAAIVMQM